MKSNYSSKSEYDTIYKNISKEVGGMGRYLYAASGESFISVLGLDSLKTPFIGVCLGTGSTLKIDLVYDDLCIPKGSEVIIERVLRLCNHGGKYHGNADDYLYFPIKSGNIVRVSRRDAPDHVFSLAESSGLGQIVSACSLPVLKSGPISDYVENKALMPIRIDCLDGNFAKIIDITKKDRK